MAATAYMFGWDSIFKLKGAFPDFLMLSFQTTKNAHSGHIVKCY